MGSEAIVPLRPPSDIFMAGLSGLQDDGLGTIHEGLLLAIDDLCYVAGGPLQVITDPHHVRHFQAVASAYVALSLPPETTPPPEGFTLSTAVLLSTMASRGCSLPDAYHIAVEELQHEYGGDTLRLLLGETQTAYNQLAPIFIGVG